MAAIAGPTQEGCGTVKKVQKNLPAGLDPQKNVASSLGDIPRAQVLGVMRQLDSTAE